MDLIFDSPSADGQAPAAPAKRQSADSSLINLASDIYSAVRVPEIISSAADSASAFTSELLSGGPSDTAAPADRDAEETQMASTLTLEEQLEQDIVDWEIANADSPCVEACRVRMFEGVQDPVCSIEGLQSTRELT